MKLFLSRIILFVFLILGCSPGDKKQTDSPLPAETRQLVVVDIQTAESNSGTLWRFERMSANHKWQPVGGKIPVVVGKNGLGWGIGLHSNTSIDLPQKKEGDGKSPAGAFLLSRVFGFAQPASVEGLKMPYLHISEMVECVDDTSSHYYTRIVRRDTVGSVDWNSSEKMHHSPTAYQWGIVVEHNSTAVPGAGSCIFLHVWGKSKEPTRGCTVMDSSHLKELIYWLDIDNHPVLVQLPDSMYRSFRQKWHLPNLP